MHSVNHAHVSHSSVNSLIMSVKRVGAHQQRHQRPAHQLKHTRWTRLPLPFYFEFKPIIIFSVNFIKNFLLLTLAWSTVPFASLELVRSYLLQSQSLMDQTRTRTDVQSVPGPIGPNGAYKRTQLDSRWCLKSLPCPPLLELSCQIRAPIEI